MIAASRVYIFYTYNYNSVADIEPVNSKDLAEARSGEIGREGRECRKEDHNPPGNIVCALDGFIISIW